MTDSFARTTPPTPKQGHVEAEKGDDRSAQRAALPPVSATLIETLFYIAAVRRISTRRYGQAA